ncbi:MAG: hypothetical protein EHM72_07005 [Calditrichaeota bacterium]|nr:MAG: hypothetical protein EHM72_07005 [Calditrichota bacterium]
MIEINDSYSDWRGEIYLERCPATCRTPPSDSLMHVHHSAQVYDEVAPLHLCVSMRGRLLRTLATSVSIRESDGSIFIKIELVDHKAITSFGD